MRPITAGVVASIVLLVSTACATDGESGLSGDNISFGGSLEDSVPLSAQVRAKLRNNGQTALALINVSSPESDTIRLAGTVDTDSIRQEAESLAYQVEGVRYVINTLEINN